MSKYNKTKTPVQPTVVNAMGEKAFQLEDKEILVSTVMTTFLQGAYYESEKEETQKIRTLAAKSDPLFVAKLALYARKEGNLRSVTHLLAAIVADKARGEEWTKRFFNKIVVRPDDMTEILGAYQHLNKLPKLRKVANSIKKGFKEALERLDPYQIDKYKMQRKEITMVDLVNLFHPAPTQKNAEAYRRLMAGESLADLYSSTTFEKTMSKAGQMAQNEGEKDDLKADAIREVLKNPKGAPYMALLRNLRNILLYAPDSVEEVCRQLTIKEKVLKSKQLPFRFASAYAEVENMSFSKSTTERGGVISFEKDVQGRNYRNSAEFETKKRRVLEALDKALEYSVMNIPKLEGNCAILIDHSGSVRGDAGGSSKVSAFSKTTSAMIGNLFGTMMAFRQDNVFIGLFGDHLIPVPIKRDMGLLEFNKMSFDTGAKCGTGTEQGMYDFLREAIANHTKIDNLIVFSDCQLGENGTSPWYGTGWEERGATFVNLFKEFKKVNPLCNTVVVNLRQAGGDSVFHRSQRILNIAGWSSNIFDVITSNCKGFDALIKEIEAIEI